VAFAFLRILTKATLLAGFVSTRLSHRGIVVDAAALNVLYELLEA
jgi:hypothetical protein